MGMENTMTRKDAIKIVETGLSFHDSEELQYRIDSYQESIDDEIERFGSTEMAPMDELDAFIEMVDLAESVAGSKMEEMKFRKQAKKCLIGYRRILIQLGFYKEISLDTVRDAVRNGIGVRMRHFPKIDGKLYDSQWSYYTFLEKML